MATSEFFIYAAEALPFDDRTGTFTLSGDYDPTTDRVRISVDDDDPFMDGDDKADEIGEDANQTGIATQPDGTAIAKGNIYAEAYAVLRGPDGETISIDRIEIEGQHVGYSPSQELKPGVAYEFVFMEEIDDAPGGDPNADNRMTYAQYEAQSVPCFVSGTMLLTRDGMMPVDWITVGDELWTQDNGWQTVRWRGFRQFEDHPDFPHAIEIAPAALGPGLPTEVMRLSPQHRVLLTGPMCELWFGTAEVLVTAKHLIGRPGVAEVTLDTDHAYHHLLFDQHEILTSHGIGLESLFLGDEIKHLKLKPSLAVTRAFSGGHTQTARLCLTRREARVLHRSQFPAALTLPQNPSVQMTTRAGAAA